MELLLPPGLCKLVCPIFTLASNSTAEEPSTPPSLNPLVISQGASTKGLGTPTRKSTWDPLMGSEGDGEKVDVGGDGTAATGRKDSAYHSYQTFD
jgi:hypothetical protein